MATSHGEWSEPHRQRSISVHDPYRINVPSLLIERARHGGDRECVRIGSEARTAEDLRSAAARWAEALAVRGIGAGDRVAVLARNSMAFVELALGCLWLGAVLVPVNTAWRSTQLAHVFRDAEPVALFVEAEFVAACAELDPPAVRIVAGIGLGGDDDAEHQALWGLPIERFGPAGSERPARRIEPGELAVVMYTSGTTGVSKGVMCPAAQLYWWTNIMRESLRLGERSVLYSTLPLFHINAFVTVLLAIAVGGRVVLDERFSASRYWERAAAEGATHIALLGAMAGMLLAQPPREADRGHSVTTAFAPDMPAQLWEDFQTRYGVEEIVAAYAGTETNQVITATQGRRSGPGYMGWAVAGYQARVVDEFDVEVPDGTPGELVLRSDLPFAFCLGYLNRPEATAAASRNLWWHTGDRVARDPDGRFRFVDRLKDMIRRRGENISTWEVEEAILTHPDIAEVAVYGVPSPLGDEDVAAAVVLRDGARLAAPELVDHLDGRIAYFAVQRYVEVVPALPHTENGKVSKGSLRERGVTDAMWDRGETVARGAAGKTGTVVGP